MGAARPSGKGVVTLLRQTDALAWLRQALESEHNIAAFTLVLSFAVANGNAHASLHSISFLSVLCARLELLAPC